MKQFKDTDYYITADGKVYRKGRQIKEWISKSRHLEYKRVTLFINGSKRNYRVHRLVAEVYISNPKNKPFVHHKDNNPFNNHVDNLEWVTKIENERYK